MATLPIKYRISSLAPLPADVTVKGAPLTSMEIDGNFRSVKVALENISDYLPNIDDYGSITDPVDPN